MIWLRSKYPHISRLVRTGSGQVLTQRGRHDEVDAEMNEQVRYMLWA